MKVALVTGSRYLDDPRYVKRALDAFNPDVVIHGACGMQLGEEADIFKLRGADKHAHIWAKENQRTEIAIPADWRAHGRPAGFIRNGALREKLCFYQVFEAECKVFAFPMGPSPGTRGMIRLVEKRFSVEVCEVPTDLRRRL